MNEAQRSGFIAILGRPNAGKSTLLNRVLGRKLSIVSSKPQTTRHNILGILNRGPLQALFVDTPGWLERPKDRLQQALRHAYSRAARDDSDALLWVADSSPDALDLEICGGLARLARPMLLALNKADMPGAERRLGQAQAAWAGAAAWDSMFRVSALSGAGIPALVDRLLALLPPSPHYFPDDQLSDRYERFFAAEIVREKLFELYGEEIPHACAVEIEDYRESPGRPDEVSARIIIERDSQKGILLGRKGSQLSRLREAAQRDIAAFVGRPVRLELWIKVRKNWRQDPAAIRGLGY